MQPSCAGAGLTRRMTLPVERRTVFFFVQVEMPYFRTLQWAWFAVAMFFAYFPIHPHPRTSARTRACTPAQRQRTCASARAGTDHDGPRAADGAACLHAHVHAQARACVRRYGSSWLRAPMGLPTAKLMFGPFKAHVPFTDEMFLVRQAITT